MSKKVLIIIILAGVLAFVTAFLLFGAGKHKTVNKDQAIKNNIKNEELPLQTQEKVSEDKEESTKSSEQKNPVKQPVKEKKKKIPQNHIKKPDESAVKSDVSPVIQKLEVKVEENSQEEINPKDFTVPVEYSSKNTYKYVYTPTRYLKK